MARWTGGFLAAAGMVLVLGCGPGTATPDAGESLDVAQDAVAPDTPAEVPPDAAPDEAPEDLPDAPPDAAPDEAMGTDDGEPGDPGPDDEPGTPPEVGPDPDDPVPDAPDAPASDVPPEVADPNQDTDQDGIPDLQEWAEGTDWRDPASATAWHPEWTARPRLFFDAADVPGLAARASAADGPWHVLWDRVAGRAAQSPAPLGPDGYDSGQNYVSAEVAETAALAGLVLADAVAVDRALALLAADAPDPTSLPSDSKYDLTEAQALVALCTAWDLLAGNPLAGAHALAAARAALVKRIDTYRWMAHEGSAAFLLVSARNNHTMKAFGALGLCALALNDRPEAALDLSEAMTGLDFLLNEWQGTPDGGYGEGWNYLEYGESSWLPFVAAYHRWAKGRELPYFGVPLLQAGSPHADRVVPIRDFADNPRTREIFRTAVFATQPDGLLPPTDDANPDALHGGILAWLFDDPDFLWAWTRPAAGLQSAQALTASFALYDGTASPAQPSGPLEGALPGAGFAVFRSSWAPDATYLVLQGEHGNARIAGEGHEHPDELSFLLWHGGRPLLLDPGYVNWANHDKVKYATDHNTILVDGAGSPYDPLGTGMDVGADAFLSPLATTGSITHTRVETRFLGVDFARRIVRLDGRFFVVQDVVDAGASSREYTFLLNGMGGGDVPDSDFAMLADGARWRNGGAWVEVHVQPLGGDPTRDHALEEHATAWGQWALHERLAVKASMAAPAGFLSVIVPGLAGQDPPTLAISRPHAGVAIAFWQEGSTIYAAADNRSGSAYVLADSRAGSAAFLPGLTLRILREGLPAEEVVLGP